MQTAKIARGYSRTAGKRRESAPSGGIEKRRRVDEATGGKIRVRARAEFGGRGYTSFKVFFSQVERGDHMSASTRGTTGRLHYRVPKPTADEQGGHAGRAGLVQPFGGDLSAEGHDHQRKQVRRRCAALVFRKAGTVRWWVNELGADWWYWRLSRTDRWRSVTAPRAAIWFERRVGSGDHRIAPMWKSISNLRPGGRERMRNWRRRSKS